MNSEQKMALSKQFYNWWAELHDPQNDGKYANRADLARMRRLKLVDYGNGPQPDLTTALGVEVFRNLQKKVSQLLGYMGPGWEDDLFVVATALARIRHNDKDHKNTAQALGGKEDSDRRMKEGRFLRLMRAQTTDDLFDQACRLTALLKQSAPVSDLASSLFLWRHDPKIRLNWARAYYHLDQYGAISSPPSSEIIDIGA